MTRRIERLQHRFVKFIPDELEDGVIYVSMEYKTVTHRCCCGCGEKVVTPLSPAGWELTFNGQSVSLSPSIEAAPATLTTSFGAVEFSGRGR